MINKDFIRVCHKVATYALKDGTKTSFYFVTGEKEILPERISFTNYTGRQGTRPATYQIQGSYKKTESGLYYDMDNRKIHTKIMSIKDFPMFEGWGEINEKFNIYDLLIIYSSNGCKYDFEIHHFRGLAKPQYLEAVCEYMEAYIKNKSPYRAIA